MPLCPRLDRADTIPFCLVLLVALGLLGLPVQVDADEPADASPAELPEPGDSGSESLAAGTEASDADDFEWLGPTLFEMREGDAENIWEALATGKVDLSNRFRAEFVWQDGLRSAQAVTNRLQLGYGTRPYRGFSGYVDFVDVRSPTYGRYNAAGLNNRPDRAIVADPELTVLNQLYGQYAYDPLNALIRGGRQRIIHDDARFVGNVGWRQNEQTYDAVTASSSFGIEHLEAQYNYVWQVNRVLGPDHPLGVFDSDSHLINIAYSEVPYLGKLTGFGYLLDFEEAPALSSNTFGFRLAGDVDVIEDELAINYIGSYARQFDAGDNPADYAANYYRIDANVEKEGWGRIGAAYEVLGSDNGQAAFQTPLATLHAYQGWADVFLTTPAQGVEDISVYAGATLPWEVDAAVRYHWYYENEGSGRLGEEFNVSFGKQINEHWNVLIKFADFNGVGGLADRQKLWLQTEIRF